MTAPAIPGYENLIERGRGSSAVVYEATEVANRRQVAVKILTNIRPDDQSILAFKREVDAMSQLPQHPHIVPLYNTGVDGAGRPYLVMPYFKGGSYAQRVDATGPIHWGELLDFSVKVASAIEVAHAHNIIHRDLKPSNVFQGDFARQPRLGDFGISSYVRPSLESLGTVELQATPSFGAPEVLNGERPTVRSDIYSLGTTMFALLEGRPPFDKGASLSSVLLEATGPGPPPQVSTDCPEPLRELISEIMAKQPEDRPESAAAVAAALTAIQIDLGEPPTEIVIPDPAPGSGPETRQATAPDSVQVVASPPPSAIDRPAPATGVDRPEPSGISIDEGTESVSLIDRPTEPVEVDPKPLRGARGKGRGARPSLGPAIFVAGGFALVALAFGALRTTRTLEPATAESAEVALWSPGLTRQTSWMAHEDWVMDLAWSPNEDLIATASTDRLARLHDPLDGSARWEGEHSGWVLDIEWSPDGTVLASADSDGMITVWQPAEAGEGEESVPLHSKQFHEGGAEAVTWQDNQVLFSGGVSGDVVRWETEAEASEVIYSHEDVVLSLQWSTAQTSLISGGKDNSARIWSSADDELISLPATDWVRSASWWTADGSGVAIAGADRTVRVVALDGEELRSFSIGSDPVGDAVWSPEGRLLGVGADDGSLRIYDVITSDLIGSTEPSGVAIKALEWDSDGTQIAVGRVDGTVEIWEPIPSP